MALITDAGLIEIRDLLPYENDLLETADKERVDIETKTRLAVDEVRRELENELGRASIDSTGTGATGFGLRNVVVTDGLRWWLQCHALHLFYLECFGHQMNERFKAKQVHYAHRSTKAKATYLERGVAIVTQPLPRAGVPMITEAAGAQEPGNYYVATAWVSASDKQSALSPMTTFAAIGTNTMMVAAGSAPQSAAGWHVYVGRSAESLVRQTALPVAPGQIWVMTQPWNAAGSPWGNEQVPELYLQPQRVFLRG
ncbi:MAG: hypothetical protein KIT83_05440 [Bryobacterales bacterium]|nr:hypothetical protein [Bryobacterales bacterium]